MIVTVIATVVAIAIAFITAITVAALERVQRLIDADIVELRYDVRGQVAIHHQLDPGYDVVGVLRLEGRPRFVAVPELCRIDQARRADHVRRVTIRGASARIRDAGELWPEVDKDILVQHVDLKPRRSL